MSRNNREAELKKIYSSYKNKILNILVGVVLFLVYRVLLIMPGAAEDVYYKLIHPLHQWLATVCDNVNTSVAEIIVGIVAISLVSYTVSIVFRIINTRRVISSIIDLILTYIMYFALIYGGFCILWGVYYSVEELNVENICGISSIGNTHEELIAVDRYFVELANEYSEQVTRDKNDCYIMDKEAIFDYSTSLYDAVSEDYSGLQSKPHRAKPVFFSRVVSYMDFTGFFFPFTGEANINVEAPDAYTPFTIAHELAHQRGIAKEDEANFVAVLSCLEDGNPDYVYSASLMALIYLQNAVYRSGDKEAWQTIRDMYSDGIVADIEANTEYWEPFRKSQVYKATNKTYDAFLKSYDQEKGVETYGECVDLIVEYYKEKVSQ